jgi:hypothetical protein
MYENFKINMMPLIFVHIPKTAGTSLRKSFSAEFNENEVLCDYGQNEVETSTKVQDAVYKNKDIYSVISEGEKLIFGHFLAKKYIHLSCYKNVITFIRNPVERVVSEFKHFQRHRNFKGTVIEFARLPRHRNMMHLYLRGIPWSALGFIGVSERYDDSLELLNKKYKMVVEHEVLNDAPKKQHVELSIEDYEAITDLNHLDVSIYEKAFQAFIWRYDLHKKSREFVHGGWLFNATKKEISGFAFFENSDSPVSISIKGRLNKVSIVIANKFHGEIHKYGGARCGYVGFALNTLTYDVSDIECFVTDTNQPIPHIG